MSVSGDFGVICIALGGIFSELLNTVYNFVIYSIKGSLF